ncbi:MAG: hypothetical protein LKJ17_09355 [Oscillospiraceae bacterium]|jgi:hypothetical protein|nr:hypothetical protein [Oscillospiraceae bacterium]
MFNFTHVLDVTTKQRYYIDRAQLESADYDGTPDGGNLFQIDLQPENSEESPILNVDLYVPNCGGTPQISKSLDSNTMIDDGRGPHEKLMDVLVEGKTLIVATNKESR